MGSPFCFHINQFIRNFEQNLFVEDSPSNGSNSPIRNIVLTNVSYFLVAVKSIKKQNLVEIRSMGNPPATVKMALESVCLMLGENTTDWKSIRGVIIKDGFINSIVNFSTEDIT